MKHQIKRVMSMALALVMLVSLFSGMATTAFADNTAIQGNNGKTVAFIENGVLHSVQTVAVGTEIVLPNASQSVDASYGFQGWVTESVAHAEQMPATVYAAGSSFTVNDHQVFYALYDYYAEHEDIPEATTPDVNPNVTDPSALEGWNIETVQLPMKSIDCFAGANGYGTGTGKSQNGTSFNAKITFPGDMTDPAHYVNFWIGEEGNGYVIQATANKTSLAFMHFPSNMSVELQPSDFGMDTLVGTELTINLTTEFFNTNDTTTDVHTGLYINGKLYKNDYITIQGTSTTAFPQDLHVVNSTAPGVTLVDVIPEKVAVTSPDALEGWDVDTVQLPMKSIDCFAGANGYGTGTGKSQNGTSFNAKITFPGDMTDPNHYVNFWIGEEGNGYVIQAGPNKNSLTFMHFPSNMSVELQPSDFGMDTLVGTELTLNLTTEFFNTDGTTTDVHTGVYINGMLYKDSYITIKGTSTTAFPQDLHIVNNTAPGVTLVDVLPVSVTPPKQLESWDVDTVQLPMKSIDCFAGANGKGTATGNSQNGTSFNATITFPGDITASNHYVNFWIGEESNGYVLQALPNSTTLNFAHIPSGYSVTLQPSDFGMDTLVGVPLNLNLTTEFFNTNGDTTDVHVGLYINGKLYKNSYITIKGASTAAFPQNLFILNNVAPGVTLVDVLITPPEQLESWNIDTVQLPMKTIDCFAGDNGRGTATGKSQNGTSFEAKITFPGDITNSAHYVNFWIGEESNGYVLQATANSTTLNFAHIPGGLSVVLQPSDFGLDTLVGVPLKVKLTTEFYNTNGDTTDVHVGLYINGQLYKNSYLTMKGVSTAAFPQNIFIMNNVAPGVTLVDILGVDRYTTDIQGLSCEHSATEDTVIAANCSVQGYTCTRCSGCQAALTVGSFTAIGDHNWREWTQTVTPYYGVAGEETRVCGICGETQTQTIAAFEGPVAFWNVSLKEDIGVNFVLALTDAQAEGATVTVAVGTAAKTENISNLSRNEKGYYVISQSVAAAQMTESINVTVKMADNEVTSSYTVRQYADYILNAANGYDIATRQLVADMLHYGAAAQTYFDVNTQNLANNKVADLNANAVPAASEQTDVQVEGEVSGVKFYGATLMFKAHIAIRYYFAVDNVDSLTACTFTVDGQQYTPVKKDDLYYVQIDNVYPQNIDEMFELTVSDGANTLSVAYGAITYISRMYHKDSTSSELKTLLQQLYDYHLSAEGMVSTISSGKKKITIAGFMGPSRVTDNNRGVSYDYITDEIYGMISDLGINLINASANNYASVGYRDAIIEALRMGERYNIDFYVMDARLSGNLSEAEVRNYIKDYSTYSAFKGINVVDEPSSSSYPAGSAGTMTNYATVSTILNNMDGVTGYSNLLPWYRYLGTEAAYRSYVNEYVQTCHPQVLSFDSYPFDDNAFASRKAYVANLSIIRDISQQYHIPFWSFVQAGSNWNNSAAEMAPTTNNSPTEAELCWSVNASLAYGAQGIEYFPLIQPYWFAYEENGGYDYARNGLIGANGEKTQWYDYAKQINQQVYSVGEVLMDAKSTDLLAFGTQAIADTGISKTSYGVLSSVQTTGNVIVGCFEYCGKDVFYVVNHDVTAAQNLTLQFAKTANYSVISDQSAESLQGSMTGASCNLTLNPGGAALIIVD